VFFLKQFRDWDHVKQNRIESKSSFIKSKKNFNSNGMAIRPLYKSTILYSSTTPRTDGSSDVSSLRFHFHYHRTIVQKDESSIRFCSKPYTLYRVYFESLVS